MNANSWSGSSCALADAPATLDSDVVELALLLPSWQADALNSAAQERGLTSGQLIRLLIRQVCSTDSAALGQDDRLAADNCQWY